MIGTWQIGLLAAAALAGAALLLARRRRAGAAEAPADAGDPFEHFRLDAADWQLITGKARWRSRLRRGSGLSGHPDAVFRRREDGSVRVALHKPRVYDGRPEWSDVYELTLHMGRLSRCWPNAAIDGVLRYTDRLVPVPWSPNLFADLAIMAAEYRVADATGEPPDARGLRERALGGGAESE